MKLFHLFSTLLFQAFLFTNLGFLGCGSTPTDQEIIQEYITKCFAEDSVYRRTVEETYRNSTLATRFRGIEIYMGLGSTENEKVQYIQSLTTVKQVTCAYVAKLNLTGQACTEIAYVDHSQKVSYEDHSRKCE